MNLLEGNTMRRAFYRIGLVVCLLATVLTISRPAVSSELLHLACGGEWHMENEPGWFPGDWHLWIDIDGKRMWDSWTRRSGGKGNRGFKCDISEESFYCFSEADRYNDYWSVDRYSGKVTGTQDGRTKHTMLYRGTCKKQKESDRNF